MQKIALVPMEEWEKVRQPSQRNVSTIEVPQQESKIKDPPTMSTPTPTPQTHPPTPPTPVPQMNSVKQKNQSKQKMNKAPSPKKENPAFHQPLLRTEDFTKKNRTKALKLLKFLKKSNKVAYNEHLEIVIKKKPVRNSNIIALVEHAVSFPKPAQKIKGVKRFYQLLHHLNVPSKLYKHRNK